MKLTRSIFFVLAFSLLTFSVFAQTGAQAEAQAEKTAKDYFDSWRAKDPAGMDKRNWWAMAAVVGRADGGAQVSFYITAASDAGKFGAMEIIVQPVLSDHDESGVPRTSNLGQAASLRIPAMVIGKGQADERAATPRITVALPPTANAVKLIAKKVVNKETVAEMVLGVDGDGFAGVLAALY